MKCFFAGLLLILSAERAYCQNMLGYTDPMGNFYVYDNGRIVHLEDKPILSCQPAANSIAYVNNTGDLKYYAGHKLTNTGLNNPAFYKNTDLYLFYSVGGNFSVFDGQNRKYLGYIQQDPYAFGDSIAGVHDYTEYFYAYTGGQFLELDKFPEIKVIAGDNTLAFVNHLQQFKIFYHGITYDADDYAPVKIEAAANTVAFIDSYHYLRVFYAGQFYELYYVPQINCLAIPNPANPSPLPDYCDGDLVYDVESGLPLFETGDDLVAFLDDSGKFFVFYRGNTISLDQQQPVEYHVTDNMLWFIDENNFFKVFADGKVSLVETYMPMSVQADRDVVAYQDHDGRLKAYYHGQVIPVSDGIVQSFTLNNHLLMYSELQNVYKFYSLDH